MLSQQWEVKTGQWEVKTTQWEVKTGQWEVKTGQWEVKTGHVRDGGRVTYLPQEERAELLLSQPWKLEFKEATSHMP